MAIPMVAVGSVIDAAQRGLVAPQVAAKRVAALAAIVLLCSPAAYAANFATCILDKMPGTQNDVAAHATMQVCLSKNPGGIQAVAQGSGRGVFGFDSGAECTAKKAGDTRSQRAAVLIGIACRKLYDESEIERFLNEAPKNQTPNKAK